MARVRSFSFTFNNYTDEGITRIKELTFKYLVFGKETSESGTPHLQGAITFKNQRSIKSVIKIMTGCHVEAAKDPVQLMLYCKKGKQPHEEWDELGVDGPDYGKDADVYESGTAPQTSAAGGTTGGQMEKDRYKRAYEFAKAGDLESIDADILVRNYGTFKKIKQEFQVVPAELATLDFHWYFGPSGTGKSKQARADYPGAYIKNSNKWWDGYVNQRAVIIEEWDPSLSCMASFMKKWCDHYAFNAETKGGTLMARPTTIIVTSNYTIRECFPEPQAHLPLERRFTVKTFQAENPHVTPGMWSSF